MTAKVELLPCPFCGSTDALRLQNTHTASFWVSCSEDDGGCGAKATGQFFPGPTRRTRFVYDPEAPEGSTFEARTLGELPPEYRRAAKSAIAAWNRRANVAHATEARDAEIEALRAEVREAREFRDKMANAIGNDQLRRFIEKHGEPVPLTIRMQEAEARAERLAEALRELVEVFSESGMYDDEVFAKAREALGQETGR